MICCIAVSLSSHEDKLEELAAEGEPGAKWVQQSVCFASFVIIFAISSTDLPCEKNCAFSRKSMESPDAMKIQHSGTLTVELPEESWYSAGEMPDPQGDNDYLEDTWSDLHEDTYTHNLGYIPIFSPGAFTSTLWWFYSESPSSPYTVNEISDFLVPQVGPWGIGGIALTLLAVVVDTTDLYFRIKRISSTIPIISDPNVLPAETYNVNYVVYYNQGNEEFDLV